MPAADVAQRVSGGRDPVDLVRTGDVGEQRLVEHEAPAAPMSASDEEQRRQLEIAGVHDPERGRGGRPPRTMNPAVNRFLAAL